MMLLMTRVLQSLPLGIPTGAPDYGRILMNMAFLILWAVVTAVAFAVVVPIAMRVFNRMTPGIDEMEELKKGNLAVAIVMSATVIAMALLVLGVILK
jgi:uncharacterized membrane protein YjfL (UPF0719 family)